VLLSLLLHERYRRAPVWDRCDAHAAGSLVRIAGDRSPGRNSPEFWHPWQDQKKFDGVLPVLWREDDTTVYRVPGTLTQPQWLDDNHARIIGQGTVQLPVNAMPGWHASRGPLRAHEHGSMPIDTGCSEACTVDLADTGSADQWICRAASLLTVVGLARRRRR
jgi:hypothetical protein